MFGTNKFTDEDHARIQEVCATYLASNAFRRTRIKDAKRPLRFPFVACCLAASCARESCSSVRAVMLECPTRPWYDRIYGSAPMSSINVK